MANQTQIPSVKTADDSVNQIQQNINKVLRNSDNKITALQQAVTQMTILGEIKFSPLTLIQFQDQAGTNWVLADGSSSIGTKYALVYGINTLPTVTVSGTNAFIKVN